MDALFFYLGLGALLMLEEAGVFLLPGDISLVAAGLHAAPDRSHLVLSWFSGSLGMIAGASVLFHGVARASALERVLPQRVKDLIRQHGVWGLAVARLVPGLRNATVFAAASANMPYTTFLYGLVPAAFVWSGALLLLGWFGGTAVLNLFGSFHHSRVLTLLSLGLLLFIVIFIWLRLRAGQSRAPEVTTRAGE